MNKSIPFAAAAAMLLAGCAGIDVHGDRAAISKEIEARGGAPLPESRATVRPAAAEAAGLTLPDAVALAMANSPALAEQQARLGLAEADLLEAARLPNPTFGYAYLDAHGSAPHPRITASLGIDLAALLTLPSRTRIAEAELDLTRRRIAAAALALAADVERDWYGALAAQSIAGVRALARDAARTSADTAAKFFEAGNTSELQLALEQAEAGVAEIDAANAEAQAGAARLALASRIGATGAFATVVLQPRLPSPPATDVDPGAMLALARGERLDLLAARDEVAAREQALAARRGFGWLAGSSLGVEREHDSDGARLTGPTLSIELPLFHQGQAAVARAEAELDAARARLAALELETDHGIALASARMALARQNAERYRKMLVPARETAVRETQKRVNYMLVGVFELLRAKREQIGAYQSYLEAVRDYWQARADLRRAVGTRLPDDDEPLAPVPEPDELGGAKEPPGHEVHHHHQATEPHHHPQGAGTRDADQGVEPHHHQHGAGTRDGDQGVETQHESETHDGHRESDAHEGHRDPDPHDHHEGATP